MPSPRIALAITGAALASACSAPPAQAPAVGWVDRICSTMVLNGARLSQLPAVDPGDPVRAKEGLLTFLTSLSESLTAVGDGITNAGAPPVADGGAAVEKALAGLEGARTSVDSARSKLAGVSVADPVAFQMAVAELADGLSGLADNRGPLRDLRENPGIEDAYREAGSCRALDGVG
ncbi:hypothetical protein JOD54_003735 [Actinokineospora baliensis]|uniref:hypothetical protein n=1 Tax=Actinokineospora baliensis TaxID=547056 RepID=UPI00195A8A35|nr:hypothetical protein [Actinokineospora baliensis]MBM7773531.1 hypothetical protein [Actinokineospora baliensis]